MKAIDIHSKVLNIHEEDGNLVLDVHGTRSLHLLLTLGLIDALMSLDASGDDSSASILSKFCEMDRKQRNVIVRLLYYAYRLSTSDDETANLLDLAVNNSHEFH